MSSTPSSSTHAAVELGRRAALPSAAHGWSRLGDDAHGVGGAVGGHDLGLLQSLAQEAGALAACLRVGEDPVDLVQRDLLAGDQAVAHGVDDLADDPDLVGLEHERVERRVDRSLERVLDRDDRALRACRPRRPSRSRRSSAAERARAPRAGPVERGSRASSLNVPSGPRKATRTCPATRKLPGRRPPAWKLLGQRRRGCRARF